MTTRTAPTVPLLRDVEADRAALAFWGVMSGSVTVDEAMGFPKAHCDTSALAWKLRRPLQQLVSRRILDGRTFQPPFDAERRCRDCGVVHDDDPIARRTGTCLRRMWGGPPALNTAGLRRGSRR